MTFQRTYGNMRLVSNKWVIGHLEPHVAIRLKQLFPRLSKTQTKDFQFPNDPIHCADLQWFVSRYPLAISDSDRDSLLKGRRSFEDTQAELERILLPEYRSESFAGLKDGFTIRPYQAQAADILMLRKRLLLGDDVGLGKTYTTIAALLRPGTLPAAIVVQTHLQKQWAEKIRETTNLVVHLIKVTTPYDLPKADVYIFKYSQLAGWVDLFAKPFFKLAAFDEIQELRTGAASLKGAAAYVLASGVDYVLGLSATPIHNYGIEAFNIFKVIDESVLGTYSDFMREWTDGHKLIKDPKALGTYLREQHIFLRRSKQEVGQQVPPVNKIIEIVDTDHKALEATHKLARELALKVMSGSFTERGKAARELDLLARHDTGVAKAKSVAAYARILLEAEVPIVLVGWHRDVYDIWLKELAEYNPVMYTGSENEKKKEEAVRLFLQGETNLFILSLRSGAGLDGLQHRCSTVLFGELDWTSKAHYQVIGRLDREGQLEQVMAIFLNSDDGSDPPMVELLGLKESQANGIIDPNAPFEAVYSDDSRVRALAKQFLSKKDMKLLDALNGQNTAA
ncbi:SNF2-related protein [Pseudomonas luteola]